MLKHVWFYRASATIRILLLTASMISLDFAQEKSPAGAVTAQPSPLYMNVMNVKPGMTAEFELLIKNEVVPALRKAGTKEYGVWKTAILGESNTYVETAPIASLAEFDGLHPLVQALGQKGAEALFAKLSRIVSGDRAMLVAMRPELSMEAKAGYVPKLGLQVISTVAPGRNREYEKNAKGITEACRKAEAKGAWVAKVGLGGNPNEYRTLVLFDSFADMQRFMQPFVKAIAEAKLYPPTGIVTNLDYAMFQYAPELSIQAPATQ